MATSTLLAPSSGRSKFRTVLWICLGLTTLFVFVTSEVFLVADYPLYDADHQQAAELKCASELMLYRGGFGAIQPVEGGSANLCWIVQKRYLALVGHRWVQFLAKMRQDCPHLAMRLAEPLLAKPIAVTHISYGHIRRTPKDGLYCIGDPAAGIPSFTGDGISIALHTARCAVATYLAGEAAPIYQARLRSALLPQMRMAEYADDGLDNSLTHCITVLPQSLARHNAGDGKG